MSFGLMFSGDLILARERRGWSQQAAAEAAKISIRQYQNIESGKTLPRTIHF